jgi:hypothetical protein
MPHPVKLCSALAVAGVLASGLGATAAAMAQSTGAPTQITVGAPFRIAAPARSPIDFAGARDVRQGRPLPAGNVIVARQVTITRGAHPAQASVRLTCPVGTVLRTIGASEIPKGVFPQVPRDQARYPGRRSVTVTTSFSSLEVPEGHTASGNLYALCR